MTISEEQNAALSEAVRNALRTVVDPEAGINIVELGLVYRIAIDDAAVHVDMTMTSPTCPMGDMILDEARQAVAAVLPQDFSLDLQLVWEPAWGPARMSDSARRLFGWDGS